MQIWVDLKFGIKLYFILWRILMTKKEIDQIFTKIILECLNVGYVINSQTFMGSDGTARIDMRKNNRFIRIFLKTIYGSGAELHSARYGDT